MMVGLDIRQLTLEDIGRWPRTVKIGAVFCLSWLLVGVSYWFIAQKNFDQYDTLKAEESGLRRSFEMKQHQASSLQAYRKQMAIMQERFDNILKQLPTQNNIPRLLEDISKTGIASGLTFELFAPLPEIQHDFYIELPIKMGVVGSYYQFAIFLSRIGQMNRIVTLHDFIIARNTVNNTNQKNNTGEPLNGQGEQLTMQLTAKIYRYRIE